MFKIKGDDKMKIIIETDARDYIMKKNKDKAITLTVARRPGSC